ncbi:hypothetical protein HUJ05_009975 [Dendroctonus ponderosae]|nr:hypothetical protein HUJ05_009975 [Dendroctonus ponderosae]
MASQKTGLILLLCGISVISGRNAGQVVRTPDGYLVSKTPATWKEAFVFCAQNGMDLVSITSADEFAAVIEALLSSKISKLQNIKNILTNFFTKSIDLRVQQDISVVFGLLGLASGTVGMLSYGSLQENQSYSQRLQTDNQTIITIMKIVLKFCHTRNQEPGNGMTILVQSDVDSFAKNVFVRIFFLLVEQSNVNYVVSTLAVSWKDAFVLCEQSGMELVSITSAKEQNAVAEALSSYPPQHGFSKGYWTSGTRFNGNSFVWFTSGKPLVYNQFADNQPDNAGNNENCMEIFTLCENSYKWNDRDCGEKAGYICQERSFFGQFILLVGQSNFKYVISTVAVPWKDAFVLCKQSGMELVSITSAEEQNAVADALSAYPTKQGFSNGYWTSGTRFNGNSFVWFTSGKPLVYTRFADKQPDNAGNNENCIEFFMYCENSYKWNDRDCSQKAGYICQERSD